MPPTSYTSFWPLQIFFTVLSGWMIYQLIELNSQQISTQTAIVQLLPQAQQAQQTNQRFIALVEDLNKTAANNPAAQQILDEFKIQVKGPASTSPAPAPGK